MSDEPMLGLATTQQLLEELSVRMEVTQNSLKGRDLGDLCRAALDNLAPSVLHYRTTGPWIPQDDVPDPVDDELVVASTQTHDNKGFSEEKCVRCGWVMGHPPLNCNNDNMPHEFPSHPPDRLASMFHAQRMLQIESFNVDPAELVDPKPRAEFLRWNMLALVAEAMEALEEAPLWKPWSTSEVVNEEAFLKEFIDLWHFFLNALWVTYGQGVRGDADVLAEVFTERYFAKRQINAQRQASGYDGVSGKCRACKRDLKESGVREVPHRDSELVECYCAGCGAKVVSVASA